jgi:septation ring formation regulator EzrA
MIEMMIIAILVLIVSLFVGFATKRRVEKDLPLLSRKSNAYARSI